MRIQRTFAFCLFLLACIALSAQEESSPQPIRNSTVPATSSTAKPSASVQLTPDANGQLSQDQIRRLMQEVSDKDQENDKRRKDYTYIQREEEHTLDGKGKIKSTEVRTREILMIYGEQVERLIAKDDRPLPEKDAAKEEARIQKIVDKRRNESAADRQRRIRKQEKEHGDDRKFVSQVSEAYNFRLVGSEVIDGRDTYVIDADPRPGFQPRSKEAKILSKIRGRIWIDKTERQWVKLDAQLLDTISFGLFLARLHRGTRIMAQQVRINDEVWLPKHESVKVDVRVALLKNFNIDDDVTYRDYKKFRADAKIVGLGEVPDSRPQDGDPAAGRH
jgi:hypothetical protein